MNASGRPLIVGVGNPQRGDDALGPLAARRCAGEFADVADCETVTGDCTVLVDWLADRDVVVIVDACRSGALPGTLHRYDLAEAPLPAHAGGVSTHGFGAADALALAAATGGLPKRCIVLAVEGLCFDFGEPLSDPVKNALDEISAQIALILNRAE